MANEKRILDKEFEEGITNRVGDVQKEAQADFTRAQKYVQADITKAQKYIYRKNDEFEAMVQEHPKAFVLGAFLGGVILGALLTKGNK